MSKTKRDFQEVIEELKKEMSRTIRIKVAFFEKLEKIVYYLNKKSKDNKKHTPENLLEEIIDACYHCLRKKGKIQEVN